MENQQALEVLQKKLDYLQAEEAIATGGAHKFELQQEIKNVNAKFKS